MLCDVVRRRRRRRRRWAHAPVIHAASHFDHKKRVAWVSISMHTCGSFFYNYGAPLGGPSGRRSSAKTASRIFREKLYKLKRICFIDVIGRFHARDVMSSRTLKLSRDDFNWCSIKTKNKEDAFNVFF